MSKFYGEVGYAPTVETRPGVWEEVIIPRNYYGDVTRNMRRYQSADKLNDDLVVNNQISIVADPYALQNFHLIRYVEWMGTKWKVSNVDVQYPRLILEIGGVYNGDDTRQSDCC
ncbi:MAG: hypothetical protein J6U54_05510 [Clostridiales bacterium]|nr:hypothetical protein [Clostridiales bacterium]